VAKKKSLSQKRKAKSDKNPKGIAKGCGMGLENRRKKTKYG
jgi:hypothetical protein